MSFCDPRTDLWWLVAFALVVAFSSATQDIALDAFRIEATDESLQGATAATYQLGYRIAVLAAGAGALYIAEFGSWPAAYQTMAALGLVGIVTTLIISEPEKRVAAGTAELEGKIADFAAGLGRPARLGCARRWSSLYGAIVCPFVDFFARYGWLAVVLLAFIGLFRLSDIAMGVMANPFYIDIGFSLEQIANVSKIFGFVMSILGALLGGALVFRVGACAAAGAVGVPDRGEQSHLRLARLGRPARSADPHRRHQRRQSGERHGGLGLHRLPVGPHQHRLHGHAIRAVQLDHDPARQGDRRLLRLDRRLAAELGGDVPAFAALLDAVGAAPKFGGYAIFFVYTALLGLPALVLAVIVRRHFEKETPPSGGRRGSRNGDGVSTVPGEPAHSGAGRGVPSGNRQGACSRATLQNRDWQCGKHFAGGARPQRLNPAWRRARSRRRGRCGSGRLCSSPFSAMRRRRICTSTVRAST